MKEPILLRLCSRKDSVTLASGIDPSPTPFNPVSTVSGSSVSMWAVLDENYLSSLHFVPLTVRRQLNRNTYFRRKCSQGIKLPKVTVILKTVILKQ